MSDEAEISTFWTSLGTSRIVTVEVDVTRDDGSVDHYKLETP